MHELLRGYCLTFAVAYRGVNKKPLLLYTFGQAMKNSPSIHNVADRFQCAEKIREMQVTGSFFAKL
jgi:hypothetical protein